MDRARRAGSTALIVVVLVGIAWRLGRCRRRSRRPSAGRRRRSSISEIQTGGASASDEFVEVANQGSAPVDLAGLEVVYATSVGFDGDAQGDVDRVDRRSTRARGS